MTGKRRQQSRTFHRTKRNAERERRSFLGDVEGGRLTGTETSVHDLLDGWLHLVADRLSPMTMREYRRLAAKRISPAIGDMPLSKLTTAQLDAHYQALIDDAGLSASSIRQVHSIIRRGLKQGVKWGWIQHDAAINATPPRVRHKRVQPPSLEQIRWLVDSADQRGQWFGMLAQSGATA